MDVSAAARGRPRPPLKPDPSEFDLLEHDVPETRRGEQAEQTDGPPDGVRDDQPDVLQAEEMSKLTEPLVRIPDSDLLKVAFSEELGAAPALKLYKDI